MACPSPAQQRIRWLSSALWTKQGSVILLVRDVVDARLQHSFSGPARYIVALIFLYQRCSL